MKKFNNTIIIGIDHGYGNMKTANCCFPTGLIAYNSEPLFTKELLVYNGKYYLIGEEHKEYISNKSLDEDFYVLTLAAIAKELSTESITEANIYIAAGLPLTWTSGQKADFSAYLIRNKEVSFTFHKQEYHLHIEGVSIYPQGYAAIALRFQADGSKRHRRHRQRYNERFVYGQRQAAVRQDVYRKIRNLSMHTRRP